MNEDRFWLLVSLRLSGEANPEELDELEKLLQLHPELGLRAGLVGNIWGTKSKSAPDREISFNKHMQRLSNHFSEPVLQYEEDDIAEEQNGQVKRLNRTRLFWVSGIAASIILGWFVVTNLPQKNVPAKKALAQNTVSTKRGSKTTKIQLPDGTEVWLNADSKLTYSENFQGALREVQLTGEAFFDVTRDETRPFVIHTNSIDVKVLGTSFNVRSYSDEKNTETSLIHGSVEVTLRNNPGKKFILKPNEKLIVPNNTMLTGIDKSDDKRLSIKQPMLGKINFQKKDSSVVETMWVKSKLVFDGEMLEDVALKLERWFDIKVTITDEKLKKVVYTGVFDDENLQVVMEALGMTGKFKYNINRKEVTIGR